MKKGIILLLALAVFVNLMTFAFTAKVSAAAESLGEYSIFGDISGEDIHNDIDSTLSIGVRFATKVPGTITKVRLYTTKDESGVYPVTLWDAAYNEELVSFDWTIQSGVEGWQETALPEPVKIEAGCEYIMVVRNNESKHYSFIPCYYRDHDWSDSLFVVHDLSGVFTGDELAMPGNINANSYPAFLRDVVFVPDYLPETPKQDEALAAENTLYVSELKLGTSYSYGTVLAVDMANDIEEIYIGEKKFDHGLTLHASPEMNKSYVEFSVEGLGMKTFAAYVGVADAMNPNTGTASMQFAVFVDGVEKAHSQILSHDDPEELLTVDITDAKIIRLTVSPADYNIGYDVDLGTFADAVVSKLDNVEEIYKSVTSLKTPEPTREPTEVPAEPEKTEAPEEKATSKPADNTDKTEKKDSGSPIGLIAGIIGAVIAALVVVIIIIMKKKK